MSLKKRVLTQSKLKHDMNNSMGVPVDLKFIKDIKKILAGQSKDKNKFLKCLIKVYDETLNQIQEDDLNNLTKLLDCREIEKIVLALKYKRDLNYREKINVIKELTKDFSLEYFFVLDNIIRTYWNDFTNAQFQKENLPNLKENYYKDDMSFFMQLSILVNIMTVIRCIKYDYCKSNIVSISDNDNISKSITNNKIMASIGPQLVIGDIDKCDDYDILDCTNNLGEVYSMDHALSMIIPLIGHISTDEITEDIYSKVVLREEYSKTVSNRICNTRLVTYKNFNIKDFLRRKILLPKNGVILLVDDKNSYIESILLKEKLGTYYNNLIIVTRYKDGSEMINTLMIKDWELSTDERRLNVYKVEEVQNAPSTADYVSSFFGMYDDAHYKYKPNYEVIAPYYWKYRDKNYKSENDVVNDKGVVIKREYSIDVAPFIRKISGEPGKEAKALADKLGVILEQGYTIVKAHRRVYNKSKQN